jgi:hypothetical protein
VQRVLGRVDRHVLLGSVEHVRHADLLQVAQVLDRLAVGQADAGADLGTMFRSRFSPIFATQNVRVFFLENQCYDNFFALKCCNLSINCLHILFYNENI